MQRTPRRSGAALVVLICLVLPAAALPAAARTPRLDFSNDDRADAYEVSLPGTYWQTTVGASLEAGEPVPSCITDAASVWYRYLAPTNMTVTVDTDGSDFDTTLSVYSGIPLTERACNDDAHAGTGQSAVSFTAARGWAYYIRVGGYGGATGNLEISFDSPDAPTCDGKVGTVIGTSGADVLLGTPNRDIIIGLGGADVVRGGPGNDLICGGDDNDRLFGGGGNDEIYGEAGNDQLLGQRGFDTLDGGSGTDKVRYSTSPSSATADLGSGETSEDGYGDSDTLVDLEQIVGSRHDDRLWGDDGGNVIWGLAGNDLLYGVAGRDVLKGGPGDDHLDGGPDRDRGLGQAGNDTCVGVEVMISC